MARNGGIFVDGRTTLLLLFCLSLLLSTSVAYRPGDVVPMSKMGQYHSSRTVWQDVIGRHCPIFAVDREVLIPIAKPTGYTGADPYKLSFQVGREKFLIPWLFLINRKSSEVPMIDVYLRYSGSDLHGVTAYVIDMPHHYIEIHPDIRKQFWDPEHWPKHVLVRYTWVEESEIDVTSGFYALFGSGLRIGRQEWHLYKLWLKDDLPNFGCYFNWTLAVFYSCCLCLAIFSGQTRKVCEGDSCGKQHAYWRNSKG